MKQIKIRKTFITYETEDGDRKEFCSRISQFSADGYLTKEESFNTEGNLLTVTENQYNEKNQLIELIQTDLENEVVDKVTYQYQDDKLVEEKEHFASGGYYILNYTYDDQGHLLSASKSDDAGNSQGRAEFTYNNNYKESIEKQYDENGSLIHEVEKHINDKDKIILEHDRNPALMEEKSVYHYDDKDLLEKVEVFTDGELIILETFTYDENGKEIKMLSQDFEDESETITTQKRDEKGRSILAEKHIDGVLEQYEKRTYDEADETTQLEVWFRVGRFNDEQLDQARYEIEYYS